MSYIAALEGHLAALKERLTELFAENEALKKALVAFEAMGSWTLSAEDHVAAENEALKAEVIKLKRFPGTLPIYGDPRPMSEAPRDGTAILAKWDETDFLIVWWEFGSWWNGERQEHIDFIGWWPLPKGTT